MGKIEAIKDIFNYASKIYKLNTKNGISFKTISENPKKYLDKVFVIWDTTKEDGGLEINDSYRMGVLNNFLVSDGYTFFGAEKYKVGGLQLRKQIKHDDSRQIKLVQGGGVDYTTSRYVFIEVPSITEIYNNNPYSHNTRLRFSENQIDSIIGMVKDIKELQYGKDYLNKLYEEKVNEAKKNDNDSYKRIIETKLLSKDSSKNEINTLLGKLSQQNQNAIRRNSRYLGLKQSRGGKRKTRKHKNRKSKTRKH